MRYSDITIQGSGYEIGLTKLIGKKVKEIRGYLASEYGEVSFKLTKVEFEDGTFLGVEGEHDFPYLVEDGITEQPNYDQETLSRLCVEEKNS